MSTKTYRDATVRVDGTTGSLVAVTTWITSASIQAAHSVFHDAAWGTNSVGSYPGIHSATIPMAFLVNSTTEPIFGKLVSARTSVSKTVEYYDGLKYYNGEFFPTAVQFSGAQETIMTGSADFILNGSMNRTSVSL